MKLASLLLWAAFLKRPGLGPTDYAVLFFLCGNYNDRTGETVLFPCDIQDRFDWVSTAPGSGLDQATGSLKRLEKYCVIKLRKMPDGELHIRFNCKGAENGS